MSDVLSRLVARARRSDVCLGSRPQFRFAAPPSLLTGAAWPPGGGDLLAEALQVPPEREPRFAAPPESPWADAAPDPFPTDAGPPAADTSTAAGRLGTAGAADPFGAAPRPPATDRQTDTVGADAVTAVAAALQASTQSNAHRAADAMEPGTPPTSLALGHNAGQPQDRAVAVVAEVTAATTGSPPEAPRAVVQAAARADGTSGVTRPPPALPPLPPSSPSTANSMGARPLPRIDEGSEPTDTLPRTVVVQYPTAGEPRPATMRRQAEAVQPPAAGPPVGPAAAPPHPPADRLVGGTVSPRDTIRSGGVVPPLGLDAPGAPAPLASPSRAEAAGPSTAAHPASDAPARWPARAPPTRPTGMVSGATAALSPEAPRTHEGRTSVPSPASASLRPPPAPTTLLGIAPRVGAAPTSEHRAEPDSLPPAASPLAPRRAASAPADGPARPPAPTAAPPPGAPPGAPPIEVGAIMPLSQGDVRQRGLARAQAAPAQRALAQRRAVDASAAEQGAGSGRPAPPAGSVGVPRTVAPGPAMSTPRAETGDRSPPMASPGPIHIDIGRIQVTMPPRAKLAPARPQPPALKAKPRGGPDT